MKIFKKKKVQTSNDYYEAYKAELSGNSKVEQNRFFSLNKVLKLELLVVALGLFIMNQNNFSLELKKMYVAGNDILPVSMQSASLDRDLIVEKEDIYLEKIKIREDDQNDILTKKVLDAELYVESSDIKLLIELLKSEMREKRESASANRIIISQK
jgi:hypothetical protein